MIPEIDKETLDFRKHILDVFIAAIQDYNYDSMSHREKQMFLDVVVKRDTLSLRDKLKLTQEERDFLWDLLESPENTKNGESLQSCFQKVKAKWLNGKAC